MIFILKKATPLFLLTASILFLNVQNSKAQMIAPPNNINPNHCRIIGKVVEIVPVKTTKNATQPCEKYACQAKIQVLKVLGTGVGFHTPLSIDKTILVKFAFTLLPTQKLFPKLNQALPGLSTGDKFQADVQGLPGMGEQALNFTIFTYKKQ
ncbi:hypothetical protein BKI52_08775 [marine bacterium AO1-C]|nr:hypothetical protein BKI52_08775 [marine bacterium AO1-C]